MNISNAQPLTAGGSGALQGQGAAGAVSGPGSGPGAPAWAPSADALPSGDQAVSAEVQTAASYLQTASGYLGQIQSILEQMASGSTTAPAGAPAAFPKLQEELLGIIGGPAGSSATGASFDGSALFGGPGASMTVATGLSAASPVAVAGPNLRQGALQSLIDQAPDGSFSMAAASPGVLSSAMEQASAASLSLDSGLAHLGATVAAPEAEGQTVTPGPILSPSEAATATAGAVRTILAQGDRALAAYSGQATPSLMGLLQAL